MSGKTKKIFIFFGVAILLLGCFYIVNKESTTIIERKVAAIKRQKPRVLIVDYETDSSVRIEKYLIKANCKVERVESLAGHEAEDYDALVIPGGHNITPSIYGADRDKHTYGDNLKLDKLQIAAVKAFVKEKKPILGICRGCQLINVALGGTIEQHIPGWHKKDREILINKNSWLHSEYGSEASVWHFHHQCVDKLADELVATQWDKSDGRIEGFEHEHLPVFGLQWHPDSMGDEGMPVFDSFKEIVIENRVDSLMR